MFEAADMKLIRANPNCLQKFEELLIKLSIDDKAFPDDEALDDRLTEKICDLMKSDTVIDGYTNLLKTGGIPYDYSESYNQLLGMVVSNRDKILNAIRNQNTARSSWQEKYFSMPRTETVELLDVQITTAKPFDTSEICAKLQRAKNSLRDNSSGSGLSFRSSSDPTKANARAIIGQCVEELGNKSLMSLREWQNQNFDGIEEVIRKAALAQLDEGKTNIICLKVKKIVKRRKKEIPPEPLKSMFTLHEAEKALDVLTQVREIILLEG